MNSTLTSFFSYRTLQRDAVRLAADVPAEHLRGVRQLAVSVLFDLQRRDPEPGVGGAAGRGQRADRGASLPNSESQQLDLLERLSGERGNDLHANFA